MRFFVLYIKVGGRTEPMVLGDKTKGLEGWMGYASHLLGIVT